MTLALKTIDQNSSFDFDDIEKVSGHVSKEPVIAFRDLCFYVSVSAADKLQLKQFNRVRFSVLKGETFDETEKLYIRPNNDDFGHNTNNYLVIESKRNTGGITISGVASLYKKIPKLGKFLEYRDKYISENQNGMKILNQKMKKQKCLNMKLMLLQHWIKSMKMNLFSISHKILKANKLCIAEGPSWKTWSNSKTVQLKNKVV